MFAVSGKPQDGSDNQLRRTSGARTFNGATDYLEARAEIRSIKAVAFKTITNRAIDQVMARELAIIWCGIGIMIICRDDNQRHLFYCGDIHPLMKGTGLHPAFADGRQADEAFLSLESFGH